LGITVVKTTFWHNDMRDTGSQEVKASIQGMLDKFLSDTDSEEAVEPVEASTPKILDPGPVAPYLPVGKEAKAANILTH
jgi:hypothetical protein